MYAGVRGFRKREGRLNSSKQGRELRRKMLNDCQAALRDQLRLETISLWWNQRTQLHDFSCKLSGLGIPAEKQIAGFHPEPGFCLALVVEEQNRERMRKLSA